ncbi:hypothetical protein OEJ37_11575 [Burkholderia sp. BKH01]|uniref:hypothetical protein n=1 Tax=Burkholderia sp. BKH01 TaxID=2769262 RepID=UPI0021E088DF|nr:hypothetical protein [Burkholderia sp. BKH01]MCU9953997.1 hypothetical protein [Burkholderia sp. BKH01]
MQKASRPLLKSMGLEGGTLTDSLEYFYFNEKMRACELTHARQTFRRISDENPLDPFDLRAAGEA